MIFHKAREDKMDAKKIICLVLVGSIVFGFLGMMGAWIVSLL